MTRKRMIKLLMGLGASRNDAVWVAHLCNGEFSHKDVLLSILSEYIRSRLDQRERRIIEGDMTGAVAGMVGSVYE